MTSCTKYDRILLRCFSFHPYFTSFLSIWKGDKYVGWLSVPYSLIRTQPPFCTFLCAKFTPQIHISEPWTLSECLEAKITFIAFLPILNLILLFSTSCTFKIEYTVQKMLLSSQLLTVFLCYQSTSNFSYSVSFNRCDDIKFVVT